MHSEYASSSCSLARLVVGIGAALLLPICSQAHDRVLRVIGDENYPAYLFLDAAGKEEGLLVDLWTLWERKTGIKVGLKAGG